jgi:hypothetical protein
MGAQSTRAAALTLVENGAPRSTIVVAQAALDPAKDDATAQKVAVAAKDLQEYVRKISGATLPIADDRSTPSGNLILVGKSRLTDAAHVDIPAGLTPVRKEEGFLIRADDTRLILAGNDAGPYHGTEYAVYDFLNRLGVRWFMPGEFGEVVPRRATVSIGPMAVREKPDFIQRDWWGHTTPEMAMEEMRWKIRNKMNPNRIFATPTDSSVRNFIPKPEVAKTDPEMFAKASDGTIDTSLPNLTNLKSIQFAAEKFKEYFRAHPEAQSLGISPVDGLPRDFNPATVARNVGFSELSGREGVAAEMSMSEEWFEFLNAVAREVKKEFPDRIITANGYANRNTPPVGVSLDPQLSVMFAGIWSDTLHSYDNPKSWMMVRQGQMLQRWTALNNKVWIYGFDYGMIVSGLTPIPGTHKLARDMPLLKKWGVVGFLNETRNVWAERGIATRYLEARLMWDADADVNAILADFYQQWYGAAAVPSRRFWEALEVTMENTPLQGHEDRILPWAYSPRLLAQLQKAQDAAEKLAVTPREKQHVLVDRLILQHLQAYVAMNDADLSGNYAEAARQADLMLQVRPKLHAISSFFMMPSEKKPNGSAEPSSGVWYWGITDRAKYYRKLADKMTGKTGSLVAMLPQRAAFTLDPDDEGRFAGWYRPDWNTQRWNSLTTAQPFYLQGPKTEPYMDKSGHVYMGAMWYLFKVDVPKVAAGRTIKLLLPTIEAEAWVWVNGQYVGHRPYRETYERPNDMDQDVTSALRPGSPNVISVRVSTSANRAAMASGLLSRAFLYSTEPAQVAPQ